MCKTHVIFLLLFFVVGLADLDTEAGEKLIRASMIHSGIKSLASADDKGCIPKWCVFKFLLQNIVVQDCLMRLRDRLQCALNNNPPDLNYLQYIVTEERAFISAMDNVALPNDISEAVHQLSSLLDAQNKPPTSKSLVRSIGPHGRFRLQITEEHLQSLLQLSLLATCVANILEVSRRTIYRRMQEYNMSVRSLYSTMTDDALDNEVRAIKSRLPYAGYQIVKGCLEAEGHHVQWTRLKASMHRVDTEGILSRMGCLVRRKYCVQGPHFLQHIDTNHKLIRFVYYI